MGIKNVNGRNVYVLEPSRASGTKTTTGKNWADLYTDLRWQVWEATQKNEATMLKLELASADQRRDYYDDKIKVLQDQRKQLQSAALKAERGSTGSANSDALRAAQGLERMARATAGKTVTTSGKVDPFGDPIPPTTRITAPTGGVDRKAKEIYETIAADFLAGEATEAEVQEAAANAGVAPTTAAAPSLDSQIERLDKELESLLSERRTAGTGVDFDLQARTRRAFAADQGVIGQGGTAFGLAPRRRRTMARVDQPLAQERIDRFTTERAEVIDRAVSDARKQRGEIGRLRGLAAELEAIGLGGEGGEADMLYREAAQLEATLPTPEEAGRAAGDAILNQIRESPEFTPRRAGELLLKDRSSRREPEPARRPAAMVSTGEMEVEEVPPSAVEPSGGMGELGLPSRSPDELEAARRAVEAAGEGLGPKTEGQLPAAPVVEERAPITDRSLQAKPVPAGQRRLPGEGLVGPAPEETPLPTGQPVELGKDDAITNPDILDSPDFIPSQSLLDEASAFYKGMTIQRDGDKPRKIRRPVQHFGGETEMVKEFLKEQIRMATPVGEEVDQEKIEAVDEKQTSSTRQRKDLYRTRVVIEGTKLARQPKKLDRLAKTNSEREDRPEHFVIVDKLMATNSGKANAFDMSYNEISRAYKDNPDQRKEAHSYLVAKDILDGDINEPLA